MREYCFTYSASSIEILEGFVAVRNAPVCILVNDKRSSSFGMEIVDNAIDEALNGYGKRITITILDDLEIAIRDEGRGMPVEKHSSGVSALQVIFTVLHAGGKFSSEGGYKTSGGLHGVGASVVNALSENLEAKVYKADGTYSMLFENGGKNIGELKKSKDIEPQGSYVRFKADETIFKNVRFSFQTICERVQESAFLLQGIEFVVEDKRTQDIQTYIYHDGLSAFMDYIHEGTEVLNETILLQGSQDNIDVKIALQYNDGYSEDVYSYVNG